MDTESPQHSRETTEDNLRYISDSSEDEMVSTFLLSEINSARFRENVLGLLEKYHTPESLLTNPDIENKEENDLRRKILSEHRGYGTNSEIFENFPSNVKWERVSLGLEDLRRIKLLNGPYWRNLSDQTRSAEVAANNIKRDKTNERILDAAKALSEGESFPPLILVSTHKGGDVVVLEGQLRLTAYLMEPANAPEEITAIIGYSPDFTKWDLY
jgi:hypothetical protein